MPFKSALYGWVYQQRRVYKKDKLEAWQIESLDALGFNWNPVIKQWQEHFEHLQAHKEQYEHCNVAASFSPTLHEWVIQQRIAYKKGKLDIHKIERLNTLGFNWAFRFNQWQEHFEQLQAHKEKYGHCNVPASFSPSLRAWVIHQRMVCKKGQLQDVRVALLHSLGFDWIGRKLLKD